MEREWILSLRVWSFGLVVERAHAGGACDIGSQRAVVTVVAVVVDFVEKDLESLLIGAERTGSGCVASCCRAKHILCRCLQQADGGEPIRRHAAGYGAGGCKDRAG